jgi:hypothetical protein
MLLKSPRISRILGSLLVLMVSGVPLWGQDSSAQLSPRELFYREQVPAQSQHAASTAKKTLAVKQAPAQQTAANSPTPPPGTPQSGNAAGNALLSETSTVTKSNPAVSHLGLRYRLLLIDTTTGDAKPVSTTQIFDQGQCFGLEFQANRAAYLYVFNLGSSGTWKALLPTPQMPEEGNFLPAFTTQRVPSSHCYRISAPSGSEHLFVVLSRNPQDVDELNRSIRDGHAAGGQPSTTPDTGGSLMTMASNLNQTVEKLASLKGRDLDVEEVGGNKNLVEASPAVYVVHTSDTPSDRVTTEIKITHR